MFCFERGRTRSPATILDRLACVIITPLKDAVPVAGLTRHCRKSQLDSFLIYEGSHVQSRKTVAMLCHGSTTHPTYRVKVRMVKAVTLAKR